MNAEQDSRRGKKVGARLRSFHHRLSLLALSFSIFTRPLDAQEPLKPVRADTPPVIDGRLDDLVWQVAQAVSGFKTYYPDYGLDMTEKTEAYVAYDSENLYFAFRCFDSQ